MSLSQDGFQGPKEVLIDVEPRNKEFRVEVMSDTTIEEVITTLIRRCEDEGINVSDWGRKKVGSGNVSFTMLRKSYGNVAIAPNVTFGELFPEMEDRETFRLDARAQVGNFVLFDELPQLREQARRLYNKKDKTPEEEYIWDIIGSMDMLWHELLGFDKGNFKFAFKSDVAKISSALIESGKRINRTTQRHEVIQFT